MNTQLLTVPAVDRSWLRAALRECIAYGEHGLETEWLNNRVTCWNCGNPLEGRHGR